MNAADVMVSNVITVGPDATVQEVAGILLKNKISAVPVVSQERQNLGHCERRRHAAAGRVVYLASPLLVAPASDGRYNT